MGRRECGGGGGGGEEGRLMCHGNTSPGWTPLHFSSEPPKTHRSAALGFILGWREDMLCGHGGPQHHSVKGDTWGIPAPLSRIGRTHRKRGSALTVSVLCGTGGG